MDKAMAMRAISACCGCVADAEVPVLVEAGLGYLPVLVRCGDRRFLSTVATVAAEVCRVEAAGGYVRDVSVPAGAWGAGWRAAGYLSLWAVDHGR